MSHSTLTGQCYPQKGVPGVDGVVAAENPVTRFGRVILRQARKGAADLRGFNVVAGVVVLVHRPRFYAEGQGFRLWNHAGSSHGDSHKALATFRALAQDYGIETRLIGKH